MNSVEIIKKKRDGLTLNDDEIGYFIDAYTRGDITDYQMSALLMATFLRGMSTAEMTALTQAMLHSGDVLDLADITGIKVDKHSTGGVGDKASLILAPIAAAAGVKVPMISGRGLGHTGGTLDKLESIPGFRVDLPIERFRRGVETVGMCLIGQTARLAPADKKIYALRDVTGTVESIPLIVASIMSKKIAEGIDALVLDVKIGGGAFMKTMDRARDLATALVETGVSMGKRVSALLTSMDEPLGACVGNALEVRESIDTLHGQGPDDVTELSIELAAEMIFLAGIASGREEARQQARQQIDNGRAADVLARCIRFQGGDDRVIANPDLLPQAAHTRIISAPETGWLAGVDAEAVGMAGVLLGGGRLRKEDAIDPAVGIRLLAKTGDHVTRDQPLAEIHYNAATRLDDVQQRLQRAFQFHDQPVERLPLIRERILQDL